MKTQPVGSGRGARVREPRRLRWAVASAMCLSVLTTVSATAASATGPQEFFDDFAATGDNGWSTRDGYADQYPGDTSNHATFGSGDGHLSMSFPGGAEHNQWWLQHAETHRPYSGSGVYEIKIDSDLTGYQQVGLSFESSPGNFMQFMLYATEHVYVYAERFSTVSGNLDKATVAGEFTGFGVPHPGPWYLRATVVDDALPSTRTWTFEWSVDGAAWTTLVDGVLETANQHVGAIQHVGIFAGNQPSGFSGFDAQIDYFRSTTQPVTPRPVVTGDAGDGSASLTWDALSGAGSYTVYRSNDVEGNGVLVGTSTDEAFEDSGLINGNSYFYNVAAVIDGVEGELSDTVLIVPSVPDPDPVPGVPVDGLVLSLDAGSLGLADGDVVSSWVSGVGSVGAVASGVERPVFVSDGVGGRASVRFDGVDDFLALGAGFEDFSGGLSMYVVARPDVLQSGMKFVALGNGAGAENVVLGRSGGSDALQYFTTSSDGSYGYFSTGSALVAGESMVMSVVQPGGSVGSLVPAVVSVDGVVVGGGDVFVPPVVTRSVNYIGKSFWAEGRFEGDVAEVLVYDRALTVAEQASLGAYLADKYSTGP